MKYKIEKNTVQETLVIPLYSRKLCTELYPNLFQDETAVRLIDQIDYDFSEVEKTPAVRCSVSVHWRWPCGRMTLPSRCGII